VAELNALLAADEPLGDGTARLFISTQILELQLRDQSGDCGSAARAR